MEFAAICRDLPRFTSRLDRQSSLVGPVCSLHRNFFNRYIKFGLCESNGKKDIDVQKIKVEKYIFLCISHLFMDLSFSFYKLDII